MRRRSKAIVSVLCVLALMWATALVAVGDDTREVQGPPLAPQDVSSGEMTCTDQTEARDVPGVVRTESFTLDGKFDYKTLGHDYGKSTLALSTSALRSAVTDKLMPQWSSIAAAVFRDQAGQLVDLYDYSPNGSCMSQSGFDAYFNMNNGPTTYKDEVWSCYSLKHKLNQMNASHAGDPGWDQLTVTGLKQISSLKDARRMMGQALYDCENNKRVSVDEILGVDEAGNTRLDALDSDDSTTGFANVVTSVNCKGASAEFDYVSFGVALYDFEAVPVAANGLTYHSGNFHETVTPKGSNTSIITNGQQQDIMHSARLGDAVTETTSTTLSALAGAKLSENVGANIGWSETEFGADSEDGEEGGSSTSGWSSTTSMGLNWGTAWEMAGAAGASAGHSQAKEISKAVETTVALPPHTAAAIDHEMTTTNYHQTYFQPVVLNYKVAIFAMSGDFSTAWPSGGINAGMYDKQSMVIKFDTKESSSPSYGCAATDDLASRIANENIDIQGYDTTGGRTYTSHSTASGFSQSSDINWDAVINVASRHFGGDVMYQARTNYFHETQGKLTVEKDKTSSDVQSIYPLYDLSYVTAENTRFMLYSNNSIDSQALAVKGYNRYDVPFYGFRPEWGEWYRCDEDGEIIGDGSLQPDDPVELTGSSTLVPKSTTEGGTIYLTWKVKHADAKPKTGESPDGQQLLHTDIRTPVVTIQVANTGLDDPHITANGSYEGFWKKPVNLNDVITTEVTDSIDRILLTQVSWESREPDTWGINVDKGTGDVTFTKPGTYHVRPYVVNNANKMVYPDWLTVTATEHDPVHHEAQPPTCDGDGIKDHYKCDDCGKYFSDAAATTEIAEADLRIPAISHAWGDWVTIAEPTDAEPGVQQRVCANDESHQQMRDLYMVRFEMNGHGAAPDKQIVPQGASATVPTAPTATGHIFEGWYTDQACTEPYNFSAVVTDNTTLYAKWTVAKYTVAIMAVGDVTEVEGEIKVDPVAKGTATIDGGTEVTEQQGEETYKYYYKEVEYGTPVSLLVTPNEGFGLKGIQAVTFNSDASMGDPFTPNKVNDSNYSMTMPAADVAVMASFAQITVTYDANAPEGVNVSNMPEPQEIGYGTIPVKPADPTAVGAGEATYELAGWFTDKECTKPYLFNSALTEDTTLYAKWMKTGVEKWTVTYTLYDVPGSDPASYTDGFKVENGSAAYDPTNDLYDIAGKDLMAAYELKKDAETGATWFTDEACTTPFSFNTAITKNTQLYAQILVKKFKVTFFDGDEQLSTKEGIAYNTPVGTDDVPEPTKPGHTLTGWVTKDGMPWNLTVTPVTSDLNLYTDWPVNKYKVTFDANGHGTAPAEQEVDEGSRATDPGALEEEGYTFGGWFTNQECTEGNEFDFETALIESNTTLFAKMTANEYTVTFDTKGRGTAPEAQKVAYGEKAAKPADPTDLNRTFVGWYTDAACTKAYDFEAPVTGDLTLYAKWAANGNAMYRLYNPNSGEHFYTASADEKNVLVQVGWKDEGIGWVAPKMSNVPVYRLYNSHETLGDHHYTTSKHEYDQLVAAGWTGEGTGWYSDEAKGTPLYRQYNPNAYSMGLTGAHNYTAQKNENDHLVSIGWKAEGIAWYGLSEKDI